MMSSTSWTSLHNQKSLSSWNDRCHANLRNLGFCPKGPLEEKDGGECFAPRVYIFFCAAARRQPRKVRQRKQERTQMFKNLWFHNLAEIHVSLSSDSFDVDLKIWKQNLKDLTIILKWIILLSELHMQTKIAGSCETTNVIQTWETLDFARRAPLKRKMEENASHHKFTFSFALLRADSLKKCANGRRREPKWPNIWNFTTLQNNIFRLVWTI